ncbi:MAG: hypothetical protein SynsKO_38330 [Synoicihabitans sp.]
MVFILADDVSAKEYTLYGGNGISTPRLDELAREGLVFQTAWTSPVCGPSRAILQTGRYPARTGYYGNWVIPEMDTFVSENLFLPQILGAAGYRTAVFGKLHTGHHGLTPKDYGYDYHYIWGYWKNHDGPRLNDHPGQSGVTRFWHPGLIRNGEGVDTGSDDFGPDILIDDLNRFIADSRDVPFYAFYSALLPHLERNTDGDWDYTPVPNLDQEGARKPGRTPGNLKSNLEYLDHLIGRVVDQLDRLNMRDNTLIIFAGDNGSIGYGKNKTTSERGPRVPFVVHGPGIVGTTGTTTALMDFSDILPTLAELCGARLPEAYAIDGRSFAVLLTGDDYQPREWIFTQFNERVWLRDENWLLDGDGDFFYCGTERNETAGYRNVTRSTDPTVENAKARFQAILASLPATDFDSPHLKPQWERHFEPSN